MCRVSLVRNTFFDISSRVKHLKRNEMPHKHGGFRFVFCVQHGLWQKQGLIKSKIKTSKKITLREEIIFAIMIGLLSYDRHWPFMSFFSLFYEGLSSTNAHKWLKKFKSAIAVCQKICLLSNHPPPSPVNFSVYGYRAPRKYGAFGFAFGIQLGLWQKRALIMSKSKNDPKTCVENLESDL